MYSYRMLGSAVVALLLAVACPVWAQPPNCDPCEPDQILTTSRPFPFAGPGCLVTIKYQVRICANRTEIHIEEISTATDCCNPNFNNATAAEMLAWARGHLFVLAAAIGGPLYRVVYPGCWNKNNATGTMTPCDDNHCCYQDMVPGNPPGPLQTIGVVPVPPCAGPTCVYSCQ
jgi:hypothetical protein